MPLLSPAHSRPISHAESLTSTETNREQAISLSSQTGSRAHIQHIYDTFICHTLSLASVQGPPRNSASRIGTEESNLKACHPQARSAHKSLAHTSTAPPIPIFYPAQPHMWVVANKKISGSVMLFRLAGGVSAAAVTIRPVHDCDEPLYWRTRGEGQQLGCMVDLCGGWQND